MINSFLNVYNDHKDTLFIITCCTLTALTILEKSGHPLLTAKGLVSDPDDGARRWYTTWCRNNPTGSNASDINLS